MKPLCLNKVISYIISLIITIFVFELVRNTAVAIDTARHEHGVVKLKWVLYFLLLFVFSGYSLILASMFLVESPVIVTEALRKSIEGLTDLERNANNLLPVQEYEELVGRVEAKRLMLLHEIKSANAGPFCGIGPFAKELITDINQDLNNAVVIANGDDKGHDCNDKIQIDALVMKYNNMITQSLATHPLLTKFRIEQRKELQNILSGAIDKENDQLTKILADLSGVPYFIFKLDLYHRSLAELETAKTVYDINYNKLGALVGPKKITLPSYLDITSAEKIAVLNTIATRLDRPSTYLYILIALASALIVSYATSLFVQHLRVKGDSNQHRTNALGRE